MREGIRQFDEAVLDVVRLIPRGKVLTYGDIAEVLERGGPRRVGNVMSQADTDAPWWRVLRSDGRPPRGLEASAVEHYLSEGTALRDSGGRERQGSEVRVDMMRSRWNPSPGEQAALQCIRRGLARAHTGAAEMSDADGELDP